MKYKRLKNVKRVFIYVSKGDEVDTHKFINYLLKKGVEVYVPKVKGSFIEVVRLRSFKDLKVGAFGVLEPKGRICDIKEFDIIFVPGVAFDKYGARLGRGKGYFDRFLRKVRGYKVGLAFRFQVLNKLPTNSKDIKVDEVITN
ncbi:MAG: 5-formyltetrahydrofolate cyclo-ligase [Thermodesulfovibrio sp.]|nr:5-formyltetrahydrofolate cyclo-ligase [Thermodesulfovibrio sp.]